MTARREALALAPARRDALFRAWALACMAATVLITWPLWRTHHAPPMLPALAVPAVSVGPALLASLALALRFPRAGLALYAAVSAYAALCDQTRLQPQFVSLPLLALGTLEAPWARALARAHLVSLWFFAGLHKLVSPEFLHDTAQWILEGLWRSPPSWLARNVGYAIALAELGTGVLAFVPRTRRIAGAAACALHVGILLDLSPLGHRWNHAVWPWNAALALAGFALISPWRDGPLATLRALAPAPRVAVAFLALAPALYHVDALNAYLAHQLYSSNVPTATRCTARGQCESDVTDDVSFAGLWVPMPPVPRLFVQNFLRTCAPGDVLTVRDPRPWARFRGRAVRVVRCPRAG